MRKILSGETDKLVLGNLNALRDWGYSPDYVEGMWLMLQYEKPDDWVLATNSMHSVREFIELSFSMRGFKIQWKGSGLNEIGYDINTGRDLIFISEQYNRPSEVDELCGDYTKAKALLKWEPKTSFYDLVKTMVDYDCSNKIQY